MFKITWHRGDIDAGPSEWCDTLTEPAENWKIQGCVCSSVLGIICRLGLTDLLTFAPLDPLLPPYLQP